MSVVVPAILAQTKEDFAELIAKMQPFAKRIHLDLMDGQFTPSTSIPLNEIILPEGWEVDIHAMFAQPDAQLPALIALKPSLIIIHAEAQGELLKTIESIHKAGIKVGVALLRSTVPEDISGLLGVADHALIFSGNLGEYGGTANMLQIEKIRLIKEINPVIEIGWDGGANISNAYTLTLGGVDVVNVGAALASAEDPVETYRQLDFEVHRKDTAKKQEAEVSETKEAA
jgi:ribulose-phosphate 3-epimerase